MKPSQSQTNPMALRARSATAELMSVAGPTIVTMVSYPLKQFIDAWMVGKLGPEALAAQGNGAIATFLPIAMFFGLCSVVNTFVAQNLGAGHPENGPPYAWNALRLCFFGWLGLLLFALAVGPIFRGLGHTARMETLEIDYARILLAGSFFTIAARSMSHFFYGVHRPMTIMFATIVGNLVNLGLDYALIFGKFGSPALGIHGAGVATVIGGAVEFAIPMIVFLSPAFHRAYATRSSRRYSRQRLLEILRLGWPAGMQWCNEILCWAIFMTVLVGSFGSIDNAAGWITLRYMQLSFMPAVGMSIAVTAVVGRHIGAGDMDAAAHRAWLGTRLAMGYMGVLAIGFVVFRKQAVWLFVGAEYTPDQIGQLLSIGSKLMIVAALFQLFDALGIVLSGALRGAGDTLWPGLVSAAIAWLLIVGGGWLVMTLAPQWRSLGPWTAAAVYIIVLGLLMAWRFHHGAWRRIEVLPGPTGDEAA